MLPRDSLCFHELKSISAQVILTNKSDYLISEQKFENVYPEKLRKFGKFVIKLFVKKIEKIQILKRLIFDEKFGRVNKVKMPKEDELKFQDLNGKTITF